MVKHDCNRGRKLSAGRQEQYPGLRKLGHNLDRELVFRKPKIVICIYANTITIAPEAVRRRARTKTYITQARQTRSEGYLPSGKNHDSFFCISTVATAMGGLSDEGKNYDPGLCKHDYNRTGSRPPKDENHNSVLHKHGIALTGNLSAGGREP